MISFTGHTGSVRRVQYSPDGTLLASGSDDGTVRLWSLVEQREVHCWAKFNVGVEAVTFVADGTLLAVGCANGEVSVWDVASRKQRWKTTTDVSGVRALVATGTMLIGATWDGPLRVWEKLKDKKPQVFDHKCSGAVTALALRPDGRTLALAFDVPPTLAVLKDFYWPSATKERMTVGPVYALAFTPDGQRLALGGTQGLQMLTPAGQAGPSFVGHRGVIYGVAFTPDGQRLISTGADATTRVWDVATGREMHVYQWHPRWATCLAIAPDGLTAATAGVDQTIVVWDMPE